MKRERFDAHFRNNRTVTEEEVDQFLAEREVIEPEPELTPELLNRVRKKIAANRVAAK